MVRKLELERYVDPEYVEECITWASDVVATIDRRYSVRPETLEIIAARLLPSMIDRVLIRNDVDEAMKGLGFFERRRLAKMLGPFLLPTSENRPTKYLDPRAWDLELPVPDAPLVRLRLMVDGMADQEDGMEEAGAELWDAIEWELDNRSQEGR